MVNKNEIAWFTMVWSIAVDSPWLAFPGGSQPEEYTWMTDLMSRIKPSKTPYFVLMTET